jgi:hypothetical protein
MTAPWLQRKALFELLESDWALAESTVDISPLTANGPILTGVSSGMIYNHLVSQEESASPTNDMLFLPEDIAVYLSPLLILGFSTQTMDLVRRLQQIK